MLKASTTTLDDIDEALRPLYREIGGKHVLDVEPSEGFALENVEGLKNALAAERRKVAEAAAALKVAEDNVARYGGMDPAAAMAALNRINSGELSADVDKAVAARVEALRAGIAEAAGSEAKAARAELATTKETLTKREKQLQKLALENVLQSELSRAKPLDDAADALLLMAAQHTAVVEVDGELVPRVIDKAGAERLDATGKPMTIRAFMSELRDSRPSLFQADRHVAGIGMTPGQTGRVPNSGGYNPWAKGSENVTQQVFMQHHDPARAARLQLEAGIR